MPHHFRQFDPPRELSRAEKDILERLLEARFPGRSTLLHQLAGARVTEECQACRTIGIVVDRASSDAADVMRRVPVEAEAVDTDGENLHILLHVSKGFIVELEVFREDLGDVNSLPTPDQLHVITLDGEKE